MSLDYLCRWQVQVSLYCAWRIPAHLRCTQCSILLHLMDICFLTCICLWQISQIQTFLFKVVGPGLVSTSPAFVSSSASHPAGPHGRHAQKTVNHGVYLPRHMEGMGRRQFSGLFTDLPSWNIFLVSNTGEMQYQSPKSYLPVRNQLI